MHTTSVIRTGIVEPVPSCIEFVHLSSKTVCYNDLLSDLYDLANVDTLIVNDS